jgi:2-hydroxychromene-2-carboxylate isomerase
LRWPKKVKNFAVNGLPLKWPSVFPRGSVLATRVALVASDEGWCGPFRWAVFSANFIDDLDIGDDRELASILRRLGKDVEPVLACSTTSKHKARLKAQVDEAAAKGIFGAPSFIIDDELFWGLKRSLSHPAFFRHPRICLSAGKSVN